AVGVIKGVDKKQPGKAGDKGKAAPAKKK
ncbi:hypothetical protein CYY_007083, partial [Polysphondylium violaceum]